MRLNFVNFVKLIVLCLPLGFATTVTAQPRIGALNLQKVFDGYWRTKQAAAQLKDRVAEFEDQLKQLLDAYQKANETYRKLDLSAADQALSDEERGKRKKQAEAKLREAQEAESQFSKLQQTARTSLDELKRRRSETILQDIQEVVAAQAKAAGYTLVFDTSARSAEAKNALIILYHNGDNDLSDQVLQQLNKAAPAEFRDKPPAR